MSIMPFVYGWLVLAGVVAGMALYRLMVGIHEDETLHLAESETSMLAEQSTVGKKIGKLDHWGKLLTWVMVLYGLVLLGFYLHGMWIEGAKIHT